MNYEEQYIDNTNNVVRNRLGLVFLTIGYFIVEFIINYTIYGQLSHSSNYFTIEAMEVWGKAVTGLGLALIITKLYFSNKGLYTSYVLREAPKSTFAVFIISCMMTIPFSFWLQNTIIDKIVESSTESQRNQAILMAGTKSALVPHYDISAASYPKGDLKMDAFDKARYPFRNKESATSAVYITNETLFMDISQNCISSSEAKLGIANSTDKAFFAYNGLNRGVDKDLYKSLIKSYYTCLYNNDAYLAAHNKNIGYPIEPIKKMYKDAYLEADRQYRKNDYYIGAKGSKELRNKLKKGWRDEMDKQFGFKTTISPKLTYIQFAKNYDVKKYYFKEFGGDKDLYPYNINFSEHVKDLILTSLPESAIPTYRGEDGELLGDKTVLTDKEVLASGKQAYKAIVIPIVGMGLSVFFLIFNVIMSVSTIVARATSKQLGAIVLAGLMFWFIAYPNISLKVTAADKPYLAEQSMVVKWLYYHEDKLSKLFRY